MNNRISKIISRAFDAVLFVGGLGIGTTLIFLMTAALNNYIELL